MSTTTLMVLPDDAPFDPIAYATGAEGFDQGVTWAQLAAMDAMLAGQEGPPEVMVAFRKSYCFGFLDAMRVKAVR